MNIFIVLYQLIRSVTNAFIRRVYWLINLRKLKGLSGVSISFPIVYEGRGAASIGKGSCIEAMASFRIASSAGFYAGKQCSFGKGLSLVCTTGRQFSMGDRCKIGEGSRLYVNENWEWGNNISVSGHCQFFAREAGGKGKFSMGDGCNVSDYCIIDLTDHVSFGRNVALGPGTTIYTHDHIYTTESAAWKGPLKSAPVEIGEGAWIGSNVTILPGVIVGRFAVVAAGAVVTKNVPDYTLFGGVPAKQIKKMNEFN